MKKRNLAVFGAAAAVAALVTTVSRSEGFERRVHASACYSDRHDIDDVFAGHGLHNASAARVSLYCPVPDDTSIPKQRIAHLAVHGYDGSEVASVSVAACSTNWAVPGGRCGAKVYSGNAHVGDYTLSPPLSQWQRSESQLDFIYLHVSLPGAGTAFSSMRGFWLRD